MVLRPAEWRSRLTESTGFVAASWSLPTTDVRVEVKDSSYREGGWHAVEMTEPAQAALS